jgi:hypothetical protein
VRTARSGPGRSLRTTEGRVIGRFALSLPTRSERPPRRICAASSYLLDDANQRRDSLRRSSRQRDSVWLLQLHEQRVAAECINQLEGRTMGINNLKLETEIFELQSPFRIPDKTPVETKPDPFSLQQILSQIAQLTVAVSQIHQVVMGQAFTRAAPAGEFGGVTEEIRKLSTRLDDVEARLSPRSQKAG